MTATNKTASRKKRPGKIKLPESFAKVKTDGREFLVGPADDFYEWLEEREDVIESKLLLKHKQKDIVPFEDAVRRIARKG